MLARMEKLAGKGNLIHRLLQGFAYVMQQSKTTEIQLHRLFQPFERFLQYSSDSAGYFCFSTYLSNPSCCRFFYIFEKCVMDTKETKQPVIFWADDDPDDVQVMKEVLKTFDQNFMIVDFPNGRELLKHLHDAPPAAHPCLIILDINMPVLDGKSTLSLIRKDQRFRSIPVVIFTTSSSELDKTFCEYFNVAMITKPPTYERLKTALRSLISYCNLDPVKA
jgi:CheY-like chemotaxis protein